MKTPLSVTSKDCLVGAVCQLYFCFMNRNTPLSTWFHKNSYPWC